MYKNDNPQNLISVKRLLTFAKVDPISKNPSEVWILHWPRFADYLFPKKSYENKYGALAAATNKKSSIFCIIIKILNKETCMNSAD